MKVLFAILLLTLALVLATNGQVKKGGDGYDGNDDNDDNGGKDGSTSIKIVKEKRAVRRFNCGKYRRNRHILETRCLKKKEKSRLCSNYRRDRPRLQKLCNIPNKKWKSGSGSRYCRKYRKQKGMLNKYCVTYNDFTILYNSGFCRNYRRKRFRLQKRCNKI